MAKILETNLCRINYSDSLEELSNATVKLLQNKIVEYKKLFNSFALKSSALPEI